MSQEIASCGSNLTTGEQTARRWGVHEIVLTGNGHVDNPFDTLCTVTFTPPSGPAHAVTVYAFYDGGDTWRARVYVTETGRWRWRADSIHDPRLNNAEGAFAAAPSSLRGMLRPHVRNPRQWMTDDGRWFLNLNDTAYALFRASETAWREYVADAWRQGITSLRAGCVGGAAWDNDTELTDMLDNYPWLPGDYSRLDLTKFQTTDARLTWLLNNYPEMYIEFILFGLKQWGQDNTGIAWQEVPLEARISTMRQMLARWAAFPQLFWLIVNDIHADEDFPNNQAFVREVGEYVAAHDQWHHLLSAGPKRFMPFPFLAPRDKWVSFIHIEHAYDLAGDQIARYAAYPMHTFLGEDRYEQDRPRLDPLHPCYYFRRLFWAALLSGGSASYGGRWRRIHPYSQTATIPYNTGWIGEDNLTYTEGLHGLDAVPHIKRFFVTRGIELWRFQPDDGVAADLDGATGKHRPKAARRDRDEYLIYHPNSRGEDREVDTDPDKTARLRVDLRDAPGLFRVEWYRAADGVAQEGGTVEGGASRDLTAPWPGHDVVLRLLR